ncbi:MAG TPA: PaaI family thioesterase [Burkholderiaceae bacterium]
MDDLRTRWQAQEDAMRSNLAAPGVVSREQMRELSGLDFLNAIAAGKLPPAPIGALLDFVPIEAEAGRIVFQGTPKPEHYNPLGTIHGGYIATLLDSAVACAIHSMLPAGKAYTTLELKLNFVRGLTDKVGPVRAEGKIINVGGQVGIAEGRLTDADGKLYAYATTTCLIFAI